MMITGGRVGSKQCNVASFQFTLPLFLQARRGSQINVNVTPTVIDNDTPEIRKYKKRFNSDILCAALWGE